MEGGRRVKSGGWVHGGVSSQNVFISVKPHSHRLGAPPQELLDHPFLRPTQQPVASGEGGGGAPGNGEVRLSKEQLTKLLLQVGLPAAYFI